MDFEKAERAESRGVAEALNHDRNLLRLLLENIPNQIYFKDRASRFIVVSQAVARKFGCSDLAQVIGQTDADFFGAAHARQAYADEQTLMRTGRPMLDKEEREDWPDGHVTWAVTSKLPLRDSAGQIIGLVGLTLDITDRKRAEEALRLQALRLQIAAEVARVVTSILDLHELLPRVVDLIREIFDYYHVSAFLVDDSGQWAGLSAASGQAAQLLRASHFRLAVGGQSLIGLVTATGQPYAAQDVAVDVHYIPHPALPATRAEAILPLLIGESVIGALDVHSTQAHAFTPDAFSILETMANQIAVAVHNARLLSTVQKHAQELETAYRTLQENQTRLLLAEKMASLGRLTAGIAHEMNSPLAAVRAALVELDKLVAEYQTAVGAPEVTAADHAAIGREMQALVHLADRAAERAAGFVRSIKSQTRDMTALERKRFNVGPVVEEVLLLLAHALRQGNCVATLEQSDAYLELYGVPGRLTQVVTNLVSNAIDASLPQGGGPVTVRVAREGAGLVLEVTDAGCGVAPENLSKIFDPMFTTKPFGQGSGLGLMTVHDIVTGEFGGTIEVSSRADAGTTFALHFPLPQEIERNAQV